MADGGHGMMGPATQVAVRLALAAAVTGDARICLYARPAPPYRESRS